MILTMKPCFTLFVMGMLLSGCVHRPTPELTLVNLQLTEATTLETTAQVTLRFANPNPTPVQLTGGVFRIYINDLYLGQGLSAEPLLLPAFATATQTVTVHLSNLRLATRIKPILESRRFAYTIRSVLYTASPTGTLRARHEGYLALEDFEPTPR